MPLKIKQLQFEHGVAKILLEQTIVVSPSTVYVGKLFLSVFLNFAPVTSLFLSSLMTDDEYLLLYLSIYFVF